MGVPLVLAFASWWRDEGPAKLQSPRAADIIADLFGLLPWWAFLLIALGTALVFVFESSFRRVEILDAQIESLREAASLVGLRAEWPSAPITYRLNLDDPEGRDGTKYTRPVEIHVEGGELVRLEGLTASVEVEFRRGAGGLTKSPESLWVVDLEHDAVWGASDAAFHGSPIDLRWSPEAGGLRALQLPSAGRVMRPNSPLRLPVLGLRVNSVRGAISLFARSGGIAHWRWKLVASTDHGVFEMEVETPIVLTNTPAPEDTPPPPIETRIRHANPTAALDQVIEIGDKLTQRIIDTQKPNPPDSEQDWRSVAETLLGSEWPDYLTDFRTAREPSRRFAGIGLLESEWRSLRRLSAQLDVLRALKESLRSGPQT